MPSASPRKFPTSQITCPWSPSASRRRCASGSHPLQATTPPRPPSRQPTRLTLSRPGARPRAQRRQRPLMGATLPMQPMGRLQPTRPWRPRSSPPRLLPPTRRTRRTRLHLCTPPQVRMRRESPRARSPTRPLRRLARSHRPSGPRQRRRSPTTPPLHTTRHITRLHITLPITPRSRQLPPRHRRRPHRLPRLKPRAHTPTMSLR